MKDRGNEARGYDDESRARPAPIDEPVSIREELRRLRETNEKQYAMLNEMAETISALRDNVSNLREDVG